MRPVVDIVDAQWGWPSADNSVYYYYPNAYQAVIDARHKLGDKHVHLVNTTGWIEWADVFSEYVICSLLHV
jgi:hypothetical protein